MGKNELVKVSAIIILGICVDRLLLYPNPQIQLAWNKLSTLRLWGIPMDTLTLALLGIAILLWLVATRHKGKQPANNMTEVLLYAITKKLEITPDEIRLAQEEINRTKSNKK